MAQTDYDAMCGSINYTGQIELFFDENGSETAPAFAKRILRWSWQGRKLGYFPK